MANEHNMRTAVRMIKRWAAYSSATRALGSPLAEIKRLSGLISRTPGDSDALVFSAHYVESTLNFAGAEGLLRWHYIGGHDVELYPFTEPGETLRSALLRHGMGQEMADNRMPVATMALKLHDQFLSDMARRLEVEPPVPRALPDFEDKTQGPVTGGECRQLQLLAALRRANLRGDFAYARRAFAELTALRSNARGDAVGKNTEGKNSGKRRNKPKKAA